MKISEELIRKCRRGDRRAQSKLYELSFDMLYSICWRYEKNAEDARYVLNMGFMKIISSLKKMPKDANFEHWAKRIMINANIDEYRKNKKRKEIFKYDDLEGSKEQNEEVYIYENEYEFSSDLLEKMICDLPESMRKIFNLYAIDGYSHNEISKMLDIPLGTSKSTLFKARKKLKESLENYKMSKAVKIS